MKDGLRRILDVVSMITEYDYNKIRDYLKSELDHLDENDPDWRVRFDNLHEELILATKKILSFDVIEQLDENGFLWYINQLNRTPGKDIKPSRSLSNFNETKNFLKFLVDESNDFESRINALVTYKGGIRGFQKTVPTIIIHLMYPEELSIWSVPLDESLKKLECFPVTAKRSSYQVYKVLNRVNNKLKMDLGINYWLLDHIWYQFYHHKFN